MGFTVDVYRGTESDGDSHDSGVADLAKEAAMMDYTKGKSARWDGSCVGGCVRTVLQMHVRVEAYVEDDKR